MDRDSNCRYTLQSHPQESGIKVDTLELPFIYPMQVLSTVNISDWPNDAFRVKMHIDEHDPQIVPVPKSCFQVVMNDELEPIRYTVIPEQVSTIQQVIVTAMTMAAKESKKVKKIFVSNGRFERGKTSKIHGCMKLFRSSQRKGHFGDRSEREDGRRVEERSRRTTGLVGYGCVHDPGSR